MEVVSPCRLMWKQSVSFDESHTFFFACEYTENVSGHIQESRLSKAMAVQTFIQGLNSGDQGQEQAKFNKLKQ